MDNKTYKIETIQDILDCVNEENVDRFISDFKNFLHYTNSIKLINENISESVGIPKEMNKLNFINFTWIDDNKKGVDIEIDLSKIKNK